MTQNTIDQRCINTLRFLAVDAVQRANSGHPGSPMGAATAAYTLWDRFLKHHPKQPDWPDRDRFVLSAGHASMLLYGLLHLTGYDLSLDELKAFRQWGSRTPGHPEYGETPGVEATTGPLGQGFAHGVGMALAERWLASRYNRPGHTIVDHHTYGIVSDGDLQEGVSAEAASLAGHLQLGKLIYIYDDNGIQIEGSTRLSFSEDVSQRFAAYGWQVLGPVDGDDLSAVASVLQDAREEEGKPSLIRCKSVIGLGSPRQNTAKAHGEPLGEENVVATKSALGWPLEPAFHVPEDVREHMAGAIARGRDAQQTWTDRMEAYADAYPELAESFASEMRGELPQGWDHGLSSLFPPESDPMATRSASGKVLNLLAQRIPSLLGGSADLAPSNKTLLEGEADLAPNALGGRNLRFGVREHAMGAIAGGMALHGGVIPYTGTFLTFSDYMRPPMRLAALMRIRAVYVFTHDSIGLGEDGPTHQPIEHLMSLRVMPNLTVIRPADARETAEAWRAALANTHGPTALILSRQNLPMLQRPEICPTDGVARGGYILWESDEGTPDLLLLGTGSEVQVALQAGERLAESGTRVRVVSMPSWELFDRQPEAYREHVLPRSVRARIAVEAGCPLGWEHYVGLEGRVVGIDRFGASAPGEVLFERFGLTVEHVVDEALEMLSS
jgi:transketolase